ncbi:hypothetical protein OO014_15120 [Intrasporangium calvum]|uniref:Uncharacterized protein n=1 Tax=Intrasporangium calvum TaxID=53358 RepID=A0ABT5GK18_9MICO|nr:hypothetical protein [Intrasporangium calvum]MDC5698588.1 hypothetical protein [Intrasporangium calvum]
MSGLRRRRVTLSAVLAGGLAALGAFGAAGGVAHAARHDAPGLAESRAATARYHSVAAAERIGYARLPQSAPLHWCIDEDLDLDDADGKPGMGVHLVNGGLLDGAVAADRPEVLVYEPTRDGGLRLVAVEYVVFAADWAATGAAGPPRLFGEDFHHVEAPNRYELPAFYALHAWVWKHNPDGVFATLNRNVTCAYSTA